MRFLSSELTFPAPQTADENGLLAIGGDVSPLRLLLAYAQGIFPWPSEGLPLLWFCPDPRFVLPLEEVHIGRSLRKAIKHTKLSFTADNAFDQVIAGCASRRYEGRDSTWITNELLKGYVELHELGYAHSVEAWNQDKLVGGLYGVSLGSAFFGESMFALEDNASKLAFYVLCKQLNEWNFSFVDCQMETQHLERFGAKSWPRVYFLNELRKALMQPTRRGHWELMYGLL